MSINNLHMHMYLIGKITLALLLVMYPGETSYSVGVRSTAHTIVHG